VLQTVHLRVYLKLGGRVNYYFGGRVDLDPVARSAPDLDMFFALLSCTSSWICSGLAYVEEAVQK
jgi:hypothetical protein